MISGDRVCINDETLSLHGQRGRIVRVDDLGWFHIRLDINRGTVLQDQEYGPFIARELRLAEKEQRKSESPR